MSFRDGWWDGLTPVSTTYPIPRFALDRTTDPTVLPVPLCDARDYVGSVKDDDARLYRNLQSATSQVEKDARRSLITQTWTLKLDFWHSPIRLYYPPVSSVTSVSSVDLNGDTQVWSSSEYDVDTTREPGFIHLGYNQSFPNIRNQPNAITIVYVAGYGSTGASVPSAALDAILLYTDYLFSGCDGEPPAAYHNLIAQFAYRGYP